MGLSRWPLCWLLVLHAILGGVSPTSGQERAYRVAVFSADITIPLGHRCMGILPVRAQRIDDPLEARGFVVLGAERPLVLAALDWCELRNGAYDQWRAALAAAAGTDRQHVLVACLHQHDAPVCDAAAQTLLDQMGLAKELYDPDFHAQCVQRVAHAVAESLPSARRVTHLGIGQAVVDKVASNRRIVLPNGRVSFGRSSRSGSDPALANAPEGEIDPYLKTLSLWDEDTPLVAIHAYATHPMSHYGEGLVSADFVGLARRRRQQDDTKVFQIYVTGCSGDVTAGKYNDGSAAMRGVLADRLYRAMKSAWQNTHCHPLEDVALRTARLELPFQEDPAFTAESLRGTLHDPDAPVADRILAAMGLSSRQRMASGQGIDMACVDFGAAQMVLFPAEAFVAYQRMAQQMRPDSFVVSIGYGECWPGYIPTEAAIDEGFPSDWRWVGRGCEVKVRGALTEMLLRPAAP